MSRWLERARLARWLPVLRAIGFVGALAIVVAMAVTAVHEIDLTTLSLWPLGAALALLCLWWGLLARGWALLVSGRASGRDIGVWCQTQALRYLPGGIWAPVSRGAIAGGRALDRLSTVAAENVLALCAALAVSALLLAFGGRPAWLLLVPVLVLPPVASRWTAGSTRIGPARTQRALLGYVIGFVAYDAAAALAQSAVSGPHGVLLVAGAAGVAWAAGLVVVIAPSGIGVRELVYVELLAGQLPRGELVAGGLTLRVITLLAELGMLLLVGRPSRTAA